MYAHINSWRCKTLFDEKKNNKIGNSSKNSSQNVSSCVSETRDQRRENGFRIVLLSIAKVKLPHELNLKIT